MSSDWIREKPTLNENDLAMAFARGEQAALEELLRTHGARLRGTALRMCGGNENVAEEGYQDMVVAVMSRRETFESGSPWLPWATQVLRHCILARWRYEQRRRHEAFDENTYGGQLQNPAELQAYLNQFQSEFDKCFKGVPPDQQEVFILHVVTGMTFIEIAKKLQLGDVASVASNPYYTARDQLRKCLKAKGFR